MLTETSRIMEKENGQGKRPFECYTIRMYCNCPWSFSTQTATSTQCTKNVKQAFPSSLPVDHFYIDPN